MRKMLRSSVLAMLGLAATAAPVLASVAAAPAASASASHTSGHAHYIPGLYHVPAIGKHVLPGLGSYLGLGDNSVRHATSVSSSNWSGYADVSETYNSVSASWTEPTVSCSSGLLGGLSGGLLGGLSAGSLNGAATSLLGGPSAAAAFWVGLDGYNSTSVEQLGTDSDCNGSTPSYYAWYEMYPNPSVDLPNTVKP